MNFTIRIMNFAFFPIYLAWSFLGTYWYKSIRNRIIEQAGQLEFSEAVVIVSDSCINTDT